MAETTTGTISYPCGMVSWLVQRYPRPTGYDHFVAAVTVFAAPARVLGVHEGGTYSTEVPEEFVSEVRQRAKALARLLTDVYDAGKFDGAHEVAP